MFEELLQKVSVKISTVRGIIETSHRLRSIVFRDSLNKQKLEENPEFAVLIEVIPSEEEWEIYDRSAVVTSTLTLGECVFLVLVNDELSYCYSAKIESIQLNNMSQNLVKIISETEVGLKFDMNARKGLTIYVTTSNQVD